MPADPSTLTLLLARLGRLTESTIAEVCTAHGTTPAELRVLSMLDHRSASSASPSDIAQWVVQTTGGLTATLRRLEADGHVARRPDPDDGRGRLVTLTPRGREFHDRLLAGVVDRFTEIHADLDIDAALAVVRDLTSAFERAAGLASSDGFVAGTAVQPVGSNS